MISVQTGIGREGAPQQPDGTRGSQPRHVQLHSKQISVEILDHVEEQENYTKSVYAAFAWINIKRPSTT